MKILKIEIIEHKSNFVAAKATVDVTKATKAELKEICSKVNEYLEKEWIVDNPKSKVRSECMIYIRGPRNKLIDIIE